MENKEKVFDPIKISKTLDKTGSIQLMLGICSHIDKNEHFWKNSEIFPLVSEYSISKQNALKDLYAEIVNIVNWCSPIFIIENENRNYQYYMTVCAGNNGSQKFTEQLLQIQALFDLLDIKTTWCSMTESKVDVLDNVSYWGITFTL